MKVEDAYDEEEIKTLCGKINNDFILFLESVFKKKTFEIFGVCFSVGNFEKIL